MTLIFPYIGNNHPNWLIFFRGVETTNQITLLKIRSAGSILPMQVDPFYPGNFWVLRKCGPHNLFSCIYEFAVQNSPQYLLTSLVIFGYPPTVFLLAVGIEYALWAFYDDCYNTWPWGWKEVSNNLWNRWNVKSQLITTWGSSDFFGTITSCDILL